MRFIRKNGRIIPIRERKDKALEAAGAAAGGAAAVYGLGKVAKRLSEATTRTEKVAKTQEKVVSAQIEGGRGPGVARGWLFHGGRGLGGVTPIDRIAREAPLFGAQGHQ